MKIAPVFEEQFHRKQDSQQQLHLSPPLPKQQTLEDISPVWASRLREKNKPTILSLTWMRWHFALQVATFSHIATCHISTGHVLCHNRSSNHRCAKCCDYRYNHEDLF
jgi:hypothetical protein